MSKTSLDVSDGRHRQFKSFNGLCVVGTRFVWQTKSACVGWVCNVGSYGTLGFIVRPFTGALGPELILMVDDHLLRG